MLKQFFHRFIILCCVLTLWIATSSTLWQTDPVPKLKIVSSIEEYKKQVALDPSMKLVNLIDYLNGVTFDIRYATNDNFTNQIIYESRDAFVRLPVAKALEKVQDSLRTLHLGLIIYDAYRPYAATVKFYEIIKDTKYVADPKVGSKHNRGCAVDVSLYDLKTGKPLPMPTEFDDFSEKAGATYMNLPKEVIQNRTLLAGVMQAFGFSIYPDEWWHFDYIGWEKYPLMNIPFEELIKNNEE